MPIHPPVAVIAGPTASGKSALALALAKRTGGVIINADSAQVYRDLPILSAAPSGDDLKLADHRLYGVRDGADPCSAAEWAAMAKAEIAAARQNDRFPILVGGTGLYLRTLIDGIAPVPAIDTAVRESVRSATVADNYRALQDKDPMRAGLLAPSDSTRVARALEVVLSTGRTLGEWQRQRSGGIGESVDLRALILLPPRTWLNQRSDRRFDAMVDNGAVKEVEALLGRGLDTRLPVMRAIGVREIQAFLDGRSTLEEAKEAGSLSTRRYAKRQATWFSNQPPSSWLRLCDPLDDASIAQIAERLAVGD